MALRSSGMALGRKNSSSGGENPYA